MANLAHINHIEFSETPLGHSWCSQFKNSKRDLAKRLIDSLYWVSDERFRVFIDSEIQRLSAQDVTAFYCEREPRRYAKRILPFYKSKKVKNRRSFFGAAMFPIPHNNSHRPEIGSEGIIANVLTGAKRLNPKTVLFHPTAEVLKAKRVKQYVLVTDLIGSGTRITNMLNAFWAIPSIRALNSAKLISFHIVTYAASNIGLSYVLKHQLKPEVHYELKAPSLSDAFSLEELKEIHSFLEHYTKKTKQPSWGYHSWYEQPLLTVFAHGAPNNLPSILHKQGVKGVKPLFKGRSTSKVYNLFSQMNSANAPRGLTNKFDDDEYIAWFLKQPQKQRHVYQVLAKIMTAKSIYHLMDITGLLKSEIESTVTLCRSNGWLEGWQITDRGRELRKYLIKSFEGNPKQSVAVTNSALYYCPMSLGAHRLKI